MTNTTSIKNDNKIVKLHFEGFSDKACKNNELNKKIEGVKLKISDSISKNISYVNKKVNLCSSLRILKDVDDYTIINLRCGTNIVHQNTIKKGSATHLEALYSLQNMVNNGEFDDAIIKYCKKATRTKCVRKRSCKASKSV